MRRWRLLGCAFVIAAIAAAATAAEVADETRWRWDDVDRVVTIGDVHGAYDSLLRILRSAGLVDERLAWDGGEAHLVMLGDLVDRGPRSRDVLDLVRRLQTEAVAAGGRVHLVLGNHEVMNMVGDLRYVSPEEYAAFAADETPAQRQQGYDRWRDEQDRKDDPTSLAEFDQLFPRGWFAHRRAFASTGEYGSWLLEQRIVVIVNRTAYLHGGLAPVLTDLEADAINPTAMGELREVVEAFEQLEQEGVIPLGTPYPRHFKLAKAYYKRWRKVRMPRVLGNVKAAQQAYGHLHALALRNDGPLWYRGSSLNPAAEELSVAEAVLAHLGAERAMVGHTPTHTGRIDIRLDGRVVRADTGMLTSHYHGQPSAVVTDDDDLYQLYPAEGARPLGAAAQPATIALANLEDTTAIEILTEAEVIAREEVGAGVTRPQRLTLAWNGTVWRAIHKTADMAVIPIDAGDVTEIQRYRYEVAAYRVDRALGLGLVPPAVIRPVNGDEGSLQLWVEDAINAIDRTDEDLVPPDAAAFERQLQRIPLFDVLIYNPIRQPTNVLVTTHDWRVHLIDHAGAFTPLAEVPPDLAEVEIILDLEIVNRLLALDNEPVLSSLREVLTETEIEALLARRDLILKPWRKQAGEHDTDQAVASAGR